MPKAKAKSKSKVSSVNAAVKSQPTSSGKRSHKAKAAAASSAAAEPLKPKKWGKKSDWPKPELKFLQSWLPSYVEMKGSKEPFWSKLFPDFLEAFPKYKPKEMPMEQESSEEASLNESAEQPKEAGGAQSDGAIEQSSIQVGNRATDQEAGQSPDGVVDIIIEDDSEYVSKWSDNKKKITQWFYNHKKDDSCTVAFQPYFKALSQTSCQPQRIPTFKYYMWLPEYALKSESLDEVEVNEDSKDRENGKCQKNIEDWDDLTNTEKKELLKTHAITIRYHVAKYLFKKEKKSVWCQLEKENEEDYDERVHKHKAFKLGMAITTEEDGLE
ncbi:hypothetical protein Moror_12218, partial [Moniliophthora roreri MCA 2997]